MKSCENFDYDYVTVDISSCKFARFMCAPRHLLFAAAVATAYRTYIHNEFGLKEVRTLDVRPADVRTATIDLRDVRTAGC